MAIEDTQTGDDAEQMELKTDTLFDRIILYISMALFLLTIILTTVQFLVRNIEQLPIVVWTAPLARIIFIVMTYFGVAVAARNSEHISIQMLLDRFEDRSPDGIRALSVLSSIIIGGVLIVAILGIYQLTVERWGQVIGGIDIGHFGLVYLAIGIGLVATLLYYVQILITDARILFDRTESGEVD